MSDHSLRFCDLCLEQYQALLHDPDCVHKTNMIPFGTVYWPDEHPFINGRFGPLFNHRDSEQLREQCTMTGAFLSSARYGIWGTSQVEPRFKELWSQAKLLIPTWPGFERLDLSELPETQKLKLPLRLRKIAGVTAHCPNCNAELRTHLSLQCFECGADWHDKSSRDVR